MGGRILTDKDRTAVLTALGANGVFVTCGRKTPNIMVAHWGTLGKLWGKNVFMLPIKSNKYSYQIVTQTKSFALNVPTSRDMRSELAMCDTISGFKCNKFETLNLHPKRARSIDAYVLGECGLIAECKVIATIAPESIDALESGLFPPSAAHTLFVGEIVECYKL